MSKKDLTLSQAIGTLPTLKKQRRHKEADITRDVFNWFEINYPRTVALEIKIKGNKLKPHQAIALKQVLEGSFSYKLPDLGRINPFDGFILKDADAFVVTCDGRTCIATGTSELQFTI